LNDQLRRLADGDRSAFEPAYAALWPIVRAFCQRMLPSRDAEDAAQLSLVKVFERAASFDARRDALPWVLAIAAWECRTARRRIGRSREDLTASALPDFVESAPTPESCVADAELIAAVKVAIGSLSEADRETLERAMTDQAPPGATFRKRRERAMARLREVWRRVYGDE
jgi:RNA polymerase sigma-70 factor (ECF subfamily)